ncbi:MAG: Fe-S cluster assembly protein SufD [Mariprofundales bacterium]|nr:Fe-S cluster assembly protein SufD [Mariprofundales bacterium]
MLTNNAPQQLTGIALPSLQDEDWKYTSLSPLVAALGAAWWQQRAGTPVATPSELTLDSIRINAATASCDRALPDGVTLRPWRESDHGLFDLPPAPPLPYSAKLARALADGGICLCIADGVELEQPILITHPEATGSSARLHGIHIGAGTNATLIDHFHGVATGAGVGTSLCQIRLQANAALDHYRIQQNSASHFHLGRIEIGQHRDSRYRLFAAELGSALSRLDLVTTLLEQGAECTLNGLMVLAGRQHADHHLHINHAAPHCRSRVHYRTVADDRARVVFNGAVRVAKGANGTDSAQTNANLLLSKRAQVDTKPELEIYNDDVKCAHGATVGQLDAEQLFYLQSRGIAKAEARQLLTIAFAEALLDTVAIPELRKVIEQAIMAKLPHGA